MTGGSVTRVRADRLEIVEMSQREVPPLFLCNFNVVNNTKYNDCSGHARFILCCYQSYTIVLMVMYYILYVCVRTHCFSF